MDPSGSCFHHDGPLGVPQCATHITCSPAPVLFLLSFVSCRLDQKFPPRSLMSVPEKCARPVSAGVGWPRSVCDRAGGMSQSAASSSCPPLVHLATPCPHGPKFSLSWGAFPPGSVCCFNCGRCRMWGAAASVDTVARTPESGFHPAGPGPEPG